MRESMTKKVLLVDDNEDFSASVAEILELAGHAVVVASEPMAALDAVKSFQPDVCLLDIGLPGMDGYDLAQKMQRDLPRVAIVAVSGGVREPEREVESGAVLHEFIGKPFTFEALMSALEKVAKARARA